MHMTMGALPPEAVPREYQEWQQRRAAGPSAASTSGANIVSAGAPSWASPVPAPAPSLSKSSSTTGHQSKGKHRSTSKHRSPSKDRSTNTPVVSPPRRDRDRPPISNPRLWQTASSARSSPAPSMYPSPYSGPSMHTTPGPRPTPRPLSGYSPSPVSYAPPPVSYAPSPFASSPAASRANIVTAEPGRRLSRADSYRGDRLAAPGRPTLGRADSRLDRSLSPQNRLDDEEHRRARQRDRDRDDDRPTYRY
jgi:hypothetical protein